MDFQNVKKWSDAQALMRVFRDELNEHLERDLRDIVAYGLAQEALKSLRLVMAPVRERVAEQKARGLEVGAQKETLEKAIEAVKSRKVSGNEGTRSKWAEIQRLQNELKPLIIEFSQLQVLSSENRLRGMEAVAARLAAYKFPGPDALPGLREWLQNSGGD